MEAPEKKYRVRHGEKVFGPMSREEIGFLLADGRIAESDEVCLSDGRWIRLTDFVNLVENEETERQVGTPVPSPVPSRSPIPPSQPTSRLGRQERQTPVPARPVVAVAEPTEEFGALRSRAGRSRQNNFPYAIVAAIWGAVVLVGVGAFAAIKLIGADDSATTAKADPKEEQVAKIDADPVPPEPPADPVKVARELPVQPRGDLPPPNRGDKLPLDAVGLLCVTEKTLGEGFRFIPNSTAFAVAENKVASRSVILFRRGITFMLEKSEDFHVFFVCPTGAFEVTGITIHPKFPASKYPPPPKPGELPPPADLTPGEAEQAIIYDVAVLQLKEKVSSHFALAPNVDLERVPSQGEPVKFARVAKADLVEKREFRPQIQVADGRLVRSPLAPAGNPFIAGLEGTFQSHDDACPLLDESGKVLGLAILNVSSDGQSIDKGPHQVLPADRISETLASSE